MIAVAVAGCSGSGRGGPKSAADYCEAMADSFCDFYLRCGRMDVDGKDECLASFANTCESRFEPRYVELERAGLLRLAADAVPACEEHLATVECDQAIQELSGPCRDLWEGLQSEGGDCSYDVEAFVCPAGTECVLDLTLCGHCKPLVGDGEACGGDTGVTCGTDALCIEGTCVARKKNGESCTDQDYCPVSSVCQGGVCTPPTFVAEGQACDQIHRCQYRLRCAAGKCERTALSGEPCSADGECDAGYCDGGVCQTLRPGGEPCDRPAQCASAVCNDDGTCLTIPGACFTAAT